MNKMMDQARVYKGQQKAHWEQFLQGQSFLKTSRAVSADLDKLLKGICSEHPDFVSLGVSLVGLGGVGRCELWPGSDVDLMLLLPYDLPKATDALDEQQKTLLERTDALAQHILSSLWDSGLAPSLRAESALQARASAKMDSTIYSALLDARLICGHASLVNDLLAHVHTLGVSQFFSSKVAECQARHMKMNHTVWTLEPNVKEGVGGLRDLQSALWISKAMGLGTDFSGMQRFGLLTQGEAELVEACYERLASIRAHLHLAYGRSQDVLTFEAQHKVAKTMLMDSSDPTHMAAMLMQGYFSVAANANLIYEILLAAFWERLGAAQASEAPLSEYHKIVGHKIALNRTTLLTSEPATILGTFEVLDQHSGLLGLESTTLRALWRASRRLDGWWSQQRHTKEQFIGLLSNPNLSFTTVSLMARLGILGAYIPAFARAMPLMQHDLVHTFTVGWHTLRLVQNLLTFKSEVSAVHAPLLHKIATGHTHWPMILISALFHDLAKGTGGDHSEKGAKMVQEFCTSHGLTDAQVQMCEFLVKEHLLMSATAQQKDLDDPEVIQSFCQRVQTPEKLSALLIFTCADIAATRPGLLNGWKEQLLLRLYELSMVHFFGSTRESDATSAQALLPSAVLTDEACPPSFIHAHHMHPNMPQLISLIESHMGSKEARLASYFGGALPDAMISTLTLHPQSVKSWTQYLQERQGFSALSEMLGAAPCVQDSNTSLWGALAPELIESEHMGVFVSSAKSRPWVWVGQKTGHQLVSLASASLVSHPTPAASGTNTLIEPHAKLTFEGTGSFGSVQSIAAEPLVRKEEFYELLVISRDMPGLFYHLTTFLAKENLSIVDAKAQGAKAPGWACDQLVFSSSEALSSDQLALISVRLTNLLADLPKPGAYHMGLGALGARAKAVGAKAQVELVQERTGYWVLQVIAPDRVGLLSFIAKVLWQCNCTVEWAKISTVGDWAQDVFLIKSNSLDSTVEAGALIDELLMFLNP